MYSYKLTKKCVFLLVYLTAIILSQSPRIDEAMKQKLINSGISIEEGKKILEDQKLTGEKIDSQIALGDTRL